MSQGDVRSLFGREAETAVLSSVLDRVKDRGGALLVRGEPGIGKSALLALARRRAGERGMRVLTCEGVTSETHLPFAGLHRLLRPILARVDDLPPPHRDAILAALGVVDAAAPDLFRIAFATLELLSGVATRTPVLLVVEDAHWLDRASWDVLAFVARRLDSDPVVLIAASRDGEGVDNSLDAARLPELRLEALDPDAAAALLDAEAPDLAPPVREQLLVEAAGNPLALVELPVAARRLAEGVAMPTWLPLTTRLEQAFASRAADLPAATRLLLLVAALDDGDALGEVLAAAGRIAGGDVGVADLTPAISARLIDVDLEETTVRFRHPLVRSAVHQTASISQRHEVQTALADFLVDQPDRRAWHRAASTIGPDEEVAAELENAAARAARRGAMAVAGAALERAAQLSGDSRQRGRRLVRAADVAFEVMGRHDSVFRLLRHVEPLGLDPGERTRLSWLREVVVEGSWSGAERVRAFVDIADRMRRDGDTDQALDALLTVALRCWWSNPDQETRGLVIAAAELIPVPEDDPRLVTVLAQAAPVERGAVVVERLRRLRPESGDPERDHLIGRAANAVGAFEEAERFLAASVEGLRAQGRLGLLAQALVSRAWAGVHLGSLDAALVAADEAHRLSAETAQPVWAAAAQLAQAIVAGRRGLTVTAETLAADGERTLMQIGANPMLAMVRLARGTAALGAGRHAYAYEQLQGIFDPSEMAYHAHLRSWAILDLAEAAAHSGHQETARAMLADLVPLVAATGSPQLRVSVACAAPMLADDEQAGPLYLAGLRADLASWPFFHARLLLAHGAYLRRRRKIADSRQPLRTARDMFDAIGAVPWGERARQELRASGEASRGRTLGTWDRLTPQESQIAQMAAVGMTNREIGEKLYLSHRTVSAHLYRIFPKLGITSRTELSRAAPVASR